MNVTKKAVWCALTTAVLGVAVLAQLETQSVQDIVSMAREVAKTEPVTEKIIPEYSESGPDGTYFSVQLEQPPLPFNPFPELEVIELDPVNRVYLLNDLNVDYEALNELLKAVMGLNGPMQSGGMNSQRPVGPGEPVLCIASLGGGLLDFTLTNALPDAVFDLYFATNVAAPHWQWRRVYTEIQCDVAGEASWVLQQPDPIQGYFVALSAADFDFDGLTDGYEEWFDYGMQNTFTNVDDSDLDGMRDGWEVQYGLNPTSAMGDDGASGNPDGDESSPGVPLPNTEEHLYYSVYDGSYDPLKIYNTPDNRAVVSIVPDNSYPVCDGSSFTIQRYAGFAADYSTPLTVYYAVGGSLSYDSGDYTLSPTPTEWPRIFSVTIPANEQQVTVTVDAPGVSANPGDQETLIVSLTPYAVSPEAQVSDPNSWQYVVDWHNNRAAITFDYEALRPVANYDSKETCRNTDLAITLTGYDGCEDPLTYSLLPGTGPMHGVLIDDTPPDLIYRPDTDYEGQDSFEFIANDGLRDSLPATVDIQVGHLPEVEDQYRRTRLGCPINIVLTGSDGCDGQHPLTFSVESQPFLGSLCGTAPNLTYDPGSVGSDSFQFSVSDGTHTTYGTVNIEIESGVSNTIWTDARPLLELAELLAAPGETVTNVSYTGDMIARGVFGNGLTAGLPYDEGVILTSGDIALAVGPNELDDGAGAGTPNAGLPDADLDLVLDAIEPEIPGYPAVTLETDDAAVLEFDITPSTNILQFDYIFASEEYEEYISNLKNDAVAIFVDGQNIAWVPGTTNEPVCVFKVNGTSNSDYYQVNPLTPNEVFNIEYDGVTSTTQHPWLSASTTVTSGIPVHVKIVIADEDDTVYDSAVFIRAKRPITCADPCN